MQSSFNGKKLVYFLKQSGTEEFAAASFIFSRVAAEEAGSHGNQHEDLTSMQPEALIVAENSRNKTSSIYGCEHVFAQRGNAAAHGLYEFVTSTQQSTPAPRLCDKAEQIGEKAFIAKLQFDRIQHARGLKMSQDAALNGNESSEVSEKQNAVSLDTERYLAASSNFDRIFPTDSLHKLAFT